MLRKYSYIRVLKESFGIWKYQILGHDGTMRLKESVCHGERCVLAKNKKFEQKDVYKTARCYRKQHYDIFLLDPSLNASNVSAVLEAVNNLDEEWKILQLSSSKWKELSQPDLDDAQCRTALVEYYLKTSPYASWEHIAGRCLYHEKDSALESAKGWIRLTKGTTIEILVQ